MQIHIKSFKVYLVRFKAILLLGLKQPRTPTEVTRASQICILKNEKHSLARLRVRFSLLSFSQSLLVLFTTVKCTALHLLGRRDDVHDYKYSPFFFLIPKSLIPVKFLGSKYTLTWNIREMFAEK